MIEQEAVAAEEQSDFVRAASLYEEALTQEASLDTLINLAVLYWQVTEYGFWTAYKLPKDFVEHAGERMDGVLALAAQRSQMHLKSNFGSDTSHGRISAQGRARRRRCRAAPWAQRVSSGSA